MKKIYVAILILLIFTISSCSFTNDKIVYIHDNSFKVLSEENFKNNVMDLDVSFEDISLNSDEEFLKYFDDLPNKGRNTLFVISERFKEIDVSNILDNYVYLNNDANQNVNNITIDLTEINYLLGIISGLFTRTNSVAILYSSQYRDLNEEFISFIEGVKLVNPRAYDSLIDGYNTLDVDSVDENGINNFINDNGSDIIFNLSSLNINHENKLILTNSIKNEEFISILYDYNTIIGDIRKNSSKNYVIDITNNVDINLIDFPEEVLDLINKYMGIIFN